MAELALNCGIGGIQLLFPPGKTWIYGINAKLTRAEPGYQGIPWAYGSGVALPDGIGFDLVDCVLAMGIQIKDKTKRSPFVVNGKAFIACNHGLIGDKEVVTVEISYAYLCAVILKHNGYP
ncbi:hypothetical protein [Parendozoicomonas haliclonae]|uniref:Uncharacterized protein n=1 Tax=Parendozoicomonas haliclonae TaxID=1960125 RepID=A0A1X7AKA1_9GAMM|nr:hypothetical protein [Parendozoicomonas haliclonae]SMA47074.1 hypothetical protein EHSB41UT_02302 [Parendozoicomonas haliclonae]